MVFVSSPGAVYQKGQACWLRKSVKPGTTLVFRVTAKVDSNAGVGTACNNVVATAANAAAARDKLCVDSGRAPGASAAARWASPASARPATERTPRTGRRWTPIHRRPVPLLRLHRAQGPCSIAR